jgi:hypothetical protein
MILLGWIRELPLEIVIPHAIVLYGCFFTIVWILTSERFRDNTSTSTVSASESDCAVISERVSDHIVVSYSIGWKANSGAESRS